MTDLTSEKQVELLPFHAINEFMRNDYRLKVVRTTLSQLSSLPNQYRIAIDHLTRQFVRVPGFRHSDKAPAMVKVSPMAEAFGKNPDLVKIILASWSELFPTLRQHVSDLLAQRQWETLPLTVDRTKLPGFFIKWPKGESFELLAKAYHEAFPGETTDDDDISLMVVWVSMRLPYQFMESEEKPSVDHIQPTEAG